MQQTPLRKVRRRHSLARFELNQQLEECVSSAFDAHPRCPAAGSTPPPRHRWRRWPSSWPAPGSRAMGTAGRGFAGGCPFSCPLRRLSCTPTTPRGPEKHCGYAWPGPTLTTTPLHDEIVCIPSLLLVGLIFPARPSEKHRSERLGGQTYVVLGKIFSL